MPRRATGGRQGGGTSWHHQTTAPGGRWQRKVEMPRAVQPKVQRGRSSGRSAPPLPGRPAGQRAPAQPPTAAAPAHWPTLPGLRLLLSHFLQLQGARGRDTGALSALKPLSQLSQAGPPPRPGLSSSPLCQSSPERISISSPPPSFSAPSPITRPNAGLQSFSLTSHSGELG